eukprot:INCI15828.2.p2 GENE.INCI15828.2~~INCI15828.2.p2  ORF type:complete len:165 (-),score=22.11 INCI15828.2:110-604(-)
MSDWIVAIFNVGDCVSRYFPRWPVLVPKNPQHVLILAAFMFVWLGLSFLSGLDFFKSDVATYVITFLFSLGNGYSSTVCMMLGPAQVPSHAKELAGNIMVSSRQCIDFFDAVTPAIDIFWAQSNALLGRLQVMCLLLGLTAGSFTGIGLATAIIGNQTCNASLE